MVRVETWRAAGALGWLALSSFFASELVKEARESPFNTISLRFVHTFYGIMYMLTSYLYMFFQRALEIHVGPP